MGWCPNSLQSGISGSKYLLPLPSHPSIPRNSTSLERNSSNHPNRARSRLSNHPPRNQPPQILKLLHLLPPPPRSLHRRRRPPPTFRPHPILPPRQTPRQHPPKNVDSLEHPQWPRLGHRISHLHQFSSDCNYLCTHVSSNYGICSRSFCNIVLCILVQFLVCV